MLGCDFAGKVERLGKDVTKVAEGDTIAGLLWGGKLSRTIEQVLGQLLIGFEQVRSRA